MIDPHVASLHYRLVVDEGVLFDNPPPLEQETDTFRIRLADGILTLEMKEHYTSENEAQKRVQPYLRAWEIQTALRLGLGKMRFVFEKADIVDRNPPPPGTPQITKVVATALLQADIRATIQFTHRQYPEPPHGFVVSPDVEAMWNRYAGYKAKREPLASMAYMCLTVLEASTRLPNGKREAAAKQYAVDKKVLATLGYLTEKVGDELTVRKMPDEGKLRPHTHAEKNWIDAVIKALIRRAGEWAFDPDATRPQLTMADFPTLPS